MKKKHQSALYWFRRDLRLRDNPALMHALNNAETVFLLYVHSPRDEGKWEIGSASKWWLHHSLNDLSEKIKSIGSKLIVRSADSAINTLLNVAKESKSTLVCWNRLYDPKITERDTKIKTALKLQGIDVETFNSSLLMEPWELKTTTNGPYQVFTPFWKSLQKNFIIGKVLNEPKLINSTEKELQSLEIDELNLLPKISWDQEFYKLWTPGEKGAQKTLISFFKSKVEKYKLERDFPGINASSTLSAHLHFGEISPKDIWHQAEISDNLTKAEVEPFLRQLGWRDFAHHLLFHFPHTESKPLKKDFEKFPWEKNSKNLKAWQKGQTGFPIVDAGMRELWHTGIMHNRVRMIVGSLLVKNLRIHWLEGAQWFWDCLIDANLANNSLGWQWIAGSGADAAPYFRIFNPISQSEKFDAKGKYLRKWVPELSNLPDKWIHKPWEAPTEILEKSGVTLGKTYPNPIINLKSTREEALEAYYSL